MECRCPGAEDLLTDKISRRDGGSLKHQIINVDLRTDLEVTVIALSAVIAFDLIGFTFNLVMAPF